MKRMPRRISLSLGVLLLVVAATGACTRASTEPESLGGQTGLMTATIDGTPWAATSLSINQGSGIVVIQAQGAVLWSADTTNGNGSLMLTSLSATKATGTYFMNLAPNLVTGATGTRVVTSGVFDVNF